jgi:hypothetical protein
VKTDTPATVEPGVEATPVPVSAQAGITPGWDRLRVVDAETGKTIRHVLEVDTEKGKLSRHEIHKGNLVRDGDSFKVVTEDRATRLEWIDAA